MINIPEAKKIFNGDLEEELTDLIVNDDIITKKMLNLNPEKSAGMNAVSPKVLKEVAHGIGTLLLTIFRKILESYVLQVEWKLANVTKRE